MNLVEVRPGAAWLDGRRPFVRLLAEATEHLQGRLELEEDFGHVGRFFAKAGGAPRPIFGNAIGLNAEAPAMLAADKHYTARLLRAEGLPAPKGHLIFSAAYADRMRLKNRRVAAALDGEEAATRIAGLLGYPLVVKPNSGSEGRGVHVVRSPDSLAADVAGVLATDDRVRLEAWVPGEDVRVTVLDGAVRLAYRRVPPRVTGDGRQSVASLARDVLDALAARHRGAKLTLEDRRIARALEEQGLTLQDAPASGRVVDLLRTANLSAGGTMEDLTGRLAPDTGALAVKAAAAVGLRLAGVDLRLGDATKSAGDAHVIEVNGAPGVDYYASSGQVQWDAARELLIDALSGG